MPAEPHRCLSPVGRCVSISLAVAAAITSHSPQPQAPICTRNDHAAPQTLSLASPLQTLFDRAPTSAQRQPCKKPCCPITVKPLFNCRPIAIQARHHRSPKYFTVSVVSLLGARGRHHDHPSLSVSNPASTKPPPSASATPRRPLGTHISPPLISLWHREAPNRCTHRDSLLFRPTRSIPAIPSRNVSHD